MIHETQAVILDRRCPYSHEKVDFERSISQIRELLVKRGISKIAEMREIQMIHLGLPIEAPVVTLVFIYAGRSFMMRFPITLMQGTAKTPAKLRMDIAGRVIFHRIKAALIEVDLGIADLTQALCPYLALTVNGKATPFHEALASEETMKMLPLQRDV